MSSPQEGSKKIKESPSKSGAVDDDKQLLKLLAEKDEEIARLTESLSNKSKALDNQYDVIETQIDVALRQRDEITNQKKEITSSILYAKRIQTALLPVEAEFKKHLKDYFILYKPKDIVSGDFYWMHHQNDKTVIIAADSTGHGVAGAFMSLMGIVYLNEIVVGKGIVQPHQILELMRKKILDSFNSEGKTESINAGMDVAAITIYQGKRKLEYSGAFNSAYIIRNEELKELKANKMPLGNHPSLNNEKFALHEHKIEEGDSLYLFSDGFFDQFGWRNNKKFMKKNFKNLLLEIQNVPMRAQRLLLENSFNNWKGDLEQIDDVLVMGIEL
jgi:serine phosphatase RsbU (regulator of sigma subunit)